MCNWDIKNSKTLSPLTARVVANAIRSASVANILGSYKIKLVHTSIYIYVHANV
jgi:hypothetical protein